jgi:hypothetical protein
MRNVWDWMQETFFNVRQLRTHKRHARSGYTKTPLYMRKVKNRKRNKAARQARKRSRPLYTRSGK